MASACGESPDAAQAAVNPDASQASSEASPAQETGERRASYIGEDIVTSCRCPLSDHEVHDMEYELLDQELEQLASLRTDMISAESHAVMEKASRMAEEFPSFGPFQCEDDHVMEVLQTSFFEPYSQIRADRLAAMKMISTYRRIEKGYINEIRHKNKNPALAAESPSVVLEMLNWYQSMEDEEVRLAPSPQFDVYAELGRELQANYCILQEQKENAGKLVKTITETMSHVNTLAADTEAKLEKATAARSEGCGEVDDVTTAECELAMVRDVQETEVPRMERAKDVCELMAQRDKDGTAIIKHFHQWYDLAMVELREALSKTSRVCALYALNCQKKRVALAEALLRDCKDVRTRKMAVREKLNGDRERAKMGVKICEEEELVDDANRKRQEVESFTERIGDLTTTIDEIDQIVGEVEEHTKVKLDETIESSFDTDAWVRAFFTPRFPVTHGKPVRDVESLRAQEEKPPPNSDEAAVSGTDAGQ